MKKRAVHSVLSPQSSSLESSPDLLPRLFGRKVAAEVAGGVARGIRTRGAAPHDVEADYVQQLYRLRLLLEDK